VLTQKGVSSGPGRSEGELGVVINMTSESYRELQCEI
jgi:hypothetical protein